MISDNPPIGYLFFVSFSKGFAFAKQENHTPSMRNLSPKIKNEQQDHLDVPVKMMFNILHDIIDVKECLLRCEMKIADIDSFSTCMAGLEESVKEVLGLANPPNPGVTHTV